MELSNFSVIYDVNSWVDDAGAIKFSPSGVDIPQGDIPVIVPNNELRAENVFPHIFVISMKMGAVLGKALHAEALLGKALHAENIVWDDLDATFVILREQIGTKWENLGVIAICEAEAVDAKGCLHVIDSYAIMVYNEIL